MMGDICKEREPLKDIVEPTLLRRSQRLNGKLPSTESSETNQCNSKIQLSQKYGKVISSKIPTQRRRRVVSCSTKRLRRGKELSAFDYLPSVTIAEDVYVPSFVSVKADEEWLCSPSVANDMYLHAKSMESRHCFSPDYLLATGSRITTDMRATLVNWLVEIHGHMKLEPETLHTAVRLLDATLQHFKVGVTRLQLCGLAVFWLATKLQSRPLNAMDLLYLMCYKGDPSILIRMEQTVLKLLNFQLQVADPIFFLNRLMLYDENGQSEEFFNTCTYCMDGILHDISVVGVSASEMANAALLAARLIDGRFEWPREIGYATEHWPTPKKLEPLALKMIQTILHASDGTLTYVGAFKKYSSRKRYYGLSESQKFNAVNLSNLITILSNSSIVD